MNLDDRALAATTDLSGSTTPALDPQAMLDRLERTRTRRQRRRVAAAAVAVAVAVLASWSALRPAEDRGLPVTPPPTQVPISGRILVTLVGPGFPGQLVYLGPDGLHEVPTGGDHTLYKAVWAPGDSIVFDSGREGPRQVFRVPVGGGAAVRLTSGPNSHDSAAVSPDGTTIAYGSYLVTGTDVHDKGLHVADIDGSDARRLTSQAKLVNRIAADDPTFSPDGRWIAYVRGDPEAGHLGLYVVRTDGSQAHRVADASPDGTSPKWSPDGSQILFTAKKPTAPGQQALWIVEATGGKPSLLTDPADAGSSSQGDWSPDGSQIVYLYYRDGWDHNEVRIMNRDGTSARTLWTSPQGRTADLPDWGQ